MVYNKLSIVILSGGYGSRLWPLSRKLLPKQFLKLTNNENTMFQETCLNAKNLNPNEIIIVCNKNQQYLVSQQIKELNINNYKIISEPFGKNTAAAIASACCITNIDNDIFVMACDHIWNSNKLHESIENAKKMNTNNNIIFLGIKPKYPETGYGYINFKNNDLIEFIEKPSIEKAQEYFDKGYLWNSGNFYFNNFYMIKQLELHANDLINNIRTTLENSKIENKIIFLKSKYFNLVPDISIDYAIMEKQTDGKIIKYDGLWLDIGCILSLYNFKNKDENNNIIDGDIYTIDTEDCFIKSQKRLIATINIKNLAIIDTDDALLISDINRSQDVKRLVKELEKNNRKEIETHSKVLRPWGWFKTTDGGDYLGFKVKTICVYPGKRLSLQSHNNRSEHWVITKGFSKITLDDSSLFLSENQYVYIPKKSLHRIENIGDTDLEFIETQIGSYLGEDDIIRYDDDFGRE